MSYLKLIMITGIIIISLLSLFFFYRVLDWNNNSIDNTTIYEINNTEIYVTKKVWGISGGDEMTVIYPHHEKIHLSLERIHNPSFDGLICYTTDTKVITKDNSLIIICHESYIPGHQDKFKVWDGVEVAVLSYID